MYNKRQEPVSNSASRGKESKIRLGTARSIGPWFGIAISISLLAWVLSTFDLAEVGHALVTASYIYLLPVSILMILTFVVRSMRWGLLFGDKEVPEFGNLFMSLMIGYLGNNILPARAGELVRAYVLGRREEMSKSAVLATVLVERICDLVVMLFLIAIMLLFFPMSPWLRQAGFVAGLLSLAAMAFLISLNIWGTPLLTWSVRRLWFLPVGSLRKIESVSNGFLTGVSGLRNRQRTLLFLAWTVIIWFVEAIIVYLVVLAFDLPLSIADALFVILGVGLGMVVPSSPGYVGTYEFFATSTLALLGVTGGEALSFALAAHAITYIGSSLLGVGCLLWGALKADPGMMRPSKIYEAFSRENSFG